MHEWKRTTANQFEEDGNISNSCNIDKPNNICICIFAEKTVGLEAQEEEVEMEALE